LLAIGDAVVVNLGHTICLKYRVIRCCCRCALDRGQATLLEGFMALPEFVSNAEFVGVSLSRDRRRSRRKSGLSDLPDVPCHPMLLPLRARSRASHAPTGDVWRCQNCVDRQILWERGLSRDRRRSRRKPGLSDTASSDVAAAVRQIAGKPRSYKVIQRRQVSSKAKKPVGVSLLAIADFQSSCHVQVRRQCSGGKRISYAGLCSRHRRRVSGGIR